MTNRGVPSPSASFGWPAKPSASAWACWLGAEEGLAHDDHWEGFAHYATHAVLAGTGALGAIAGTIKVTEEMSAVSARGDAAAEELVSRAHDAGVLRRDVGAVDIALLVEQLGRSPLVEQLTKQGHAALVDAAQHARSRLIAITRYGLHRRIAGRARWRGRRGRPGRRGR
jgi:hypothetical protein